MPRRLLLRLSRGFSRNFILLRHETALARGRGNLKHLELAIATAQTSCWRRTLKALRRLNARRFVVTLYARPAFGFLARSLLPAYDAQNHTAPQLGTHGQSSAGSDDRENIGFVWFVAAKSL